MNSKEIFINSFERLENYKSYIDKRNKVLESILGGSETRIFDFPGVEELISSTTDTVNVIFPTVNRETIFDYIEWFIYDNEFGKEELEINNEKIKNAEDLYNFFEGYFND